MNYSYNKIIPFLSLRKKLIIAFALLSTIPLLIFGMVGIYKSMESMREIALENLSHNVEIINERAQNFIININNDIQYLTSTSEFKTFINKDNIWDKNSVNDSRKVSTQILDFISSRKMFYQIRFISADSNELFRIQQLDSSYKIIPKDKLSEGSFKYYFILTEKSDKKNISIIPTELINEKNRTIPTISFALKIFNDSGNFCGILITDIYAKELFQVLEHNTQLTFGQEIVIVNSEGNYLYHSEKKKNWNSLLAHKTEENIFEKYSKEFTNAIISVNSGFISDNDDEIIAYEPLFITSFVEGTSYFIFEKVNKKNIFAQARSFAYISVIFIAIFLLISIPMGLLATNQIVKPIKELKRGAEIIAQGNYSHKLNIRTNDEIEELTYQFNIMAQVLAEREHQLANHQKKLERTVIERTSELNNEKEKIQVILDNVPSAFLLIDNDQKILTASAAIKDIAGVSPLDIINENCSLVLGSDLICKNCTLKFSDSEKKVSNFIESKIDNSGEVVYIEHISIPLSLTDNKSAVLEILTDITNRKKTEEHLLKLEKLITIGETTALIAHEFRNSLTSVKMFIQLQRESSVSKDDVDSLNQSLDSITRMEKIVNNLLGFSRAVNPVLIAGDINMIINECLLFVQPQFRKKNISIKKTLNASIPHILMDENLLKEGIINLIINAEQAIKTDGEIFVSTDLVIQKTEINDFAYVDKVKQNKTAGQYKINLPKGSQLIKIEIHDNGMGIARQNLHKIFDPFFTTKSGGSGLGLAMVKRTINQHGGVVLVESSPKAGTTFKILLPLRNAYEG